MKGAAYGFVLFYTSAAAFRTEKLAVAAGLPGTRLVPTPRELSSDCGVALRFSLAAAVTAIDGNADGNADDSRAAMERLLVDAKVPYERIVAEPGGQTP